MNALYSALACVACTLLWVDMTHQMVQEITSEDNNDNSTSSTTEINVPIVESKTSSEGLSQNCSTARGLAGNCLQRQFCEYSTFAIDLTLFMPHGYKSACATGEVCCPAQYQRVAARAPDSAQADAAFAFDEDD